jgi:CDP-ribitol ribitolphosphotransferase
MNRFEYLLATTILRLCRLVFLLLPVHAKRVVLASARNATLEGNLRHLYLAMRERHPDLEYVLLLEPYSYRFLGKAIYLLRLLRGMYHLCTARLFIVDNAYFPIHVAPHRRGTEVVQVWHAAGALKRFGMDTLVPPAEPERSFLHRHYDWVISSADASRTPYAAALRTPIERVLPLGSPRTDALFDATTLAASRERLLTAHPQLAGRRVVLYAPTFRGRGRRKRAAPGLDARQLRRLLPPEYALVLKAHPNLDRAATPKDGYDLVIDASAEINELFAVTDVLVTDYSSVIFEYALLRRPLVLLVPDLAEYEREVGLSLDYRSEMIGTQVADTPSVAAAILHDDFDLGPYERFVTRHLGTATGGARSRFVDLFVTPWAGDEVARAAGGVARTADEARTAPEAARTAAEAAPAVEGSDTLRAHVSHD